MRNTTERNADKSFTSPTRTCWSIPCAAEDRMQSAADSNTEKPLQLPIRKRWSTPRVIISEVEDAEKLINLIEISLLPTGPS